MIAVAEAISWAELQRQALDGAHAAWFDDLPPQLLDAARDDAAGRRLLARRLAGIAPQLFAGFPAVLPAALAANARLRTSRHSLDEQALDLGALAFAPMLRLMIARDEVVRLRRVLGAARYARTLAAADRGPAPPASAAAALAEACGADETLHRLFLEQGRAEWAAHANVVHPAALEWLRLCHAPGTLDAAAAAWLDTASVARALAISEEESRDDRQSRHH